MHGFPQFDAAMPDFIAPVPGFAGLGAWGYESGLFPPMSPWADYSGIPGYPGLGDHSGLPPSLGKEEPMRLDLSNATADSSFHTSPSEFQMGLAHSVETKRPRNFEMSDTAAEFVPPPPGLGVSDCCDMEPVLVDVSQMVSDISFAPPGLLPPPGLEEVSAVSKTCSSKQAASTPGSLSTTEPESLPEDMRSTRSTSSDEGDAKGRRLAAPAAPLLGRAVSLPVPPTWQLDLERAVSIPRVDIPRELRIVRDESGQVDVLWPVDARKLAGKDRQIISSGFELFPDIVCKLMIKPKPKGLSKGLASFQKARGCGSIELKIVEGSEAPAFSFKVSIGSDDRKEGPRGPVKHSFASSSVCGLPRDAEDWDFKAATDPDTNTFLVSLEVLS